MSTESKPPGLIAVPTICLIISTIFIFARVYTRLFIVRIFQIDDYLLLFAWLLNIGLTVISLLQVAYGAGHHIWDIPPSAFKPNLQLLYATGILYAMLLPVTKLSICLLYLGAFGQDYTSRISILCMAAYLVITGALTTICMAFACKPISAYWNNPLSGQCARQLASVITYFISGSNIFTDIALIAIAYPQLRTLQLSLRHKFALYAVMCLGWLAAASAIIRIVATSKVVNSADPTWTQVGMIYWSAVEANTSLICAAAPCLLPLVKKFLPRLLSSGRHELGSNQLNEQSPRNSMEIEMPAIVSVKTEDPLSTVGNGSSDHVNNRQWVVHDGNSQISILEFRYQERSMSTC